MNKDKTHSYLASRVINFTAVSLKLGALAFSIVTMLCIMLLLAGSAYAQDEYFVPLESTTDIAPSNDMQFNIPLQPTIAEAGADGDLENEFDKMMDIGKTTFPGWI